MLNEFERNERMHQLGASDIHKIFNFNNKGAFDLWQEKMGLIEKPQIETRSMTAGNLLEEDCLVFFFNRKGIIDYTLNERIEHAEIKNFVVSTDGIFGITPVENKTTKMSKFATLSSPERNHYLQLHAQMSCLGSEKGYIVYNAVTDEDLNNPLLYVPSELKQEVFEIKADIDLIKEIESRAKYFLWCVEYKRRPTEQDYISQLF